MSREHLARYDIATEHDWQNEIFPRDAEFYAGLLTRKQEFLAMTGLTMQASSNLPGSIATMVQEQCRKLTLHDALRDRHLESGRRYYDGMNTELWKHESTMSERQSDLIVQSNTNRTGFGNARILLNTLRYGTLILAGLGI